MGAGKKRSITFNQGESEQEIIEAKGILKGDLAVYINDGLPSTSSMFSYTYVNTLRKVDFRIELK